MTAVRRLFLSLLLPVLGLGGCKVDSTHPISALDDAQPDPAIYGLWRLKAGGELTYVHIGPEFSLRSSGGQKSGGRVRIVIVDHKPNGITDESYVAHVSRVGARRFLNVVQVDAGKPVGFIFVQYTLVDRNTLRFATIDDTVLKAAISAGRIKGTMRGDGLASETTITAESGEIAEFLQREGGKLFVEPVVLRRVVEVRAHPNTPEGPR